MTSFLGDLDPAVKLRISALILAVFWILALTSGPVFMHCPDICPSLVVGWIMIILFDLSSMALIVTVLFRPLNHYLRPCALAAMAATLASFAYGFASAALGSCVARCVVSSTQFIWSFVITIATIAVSYRALRRPQENKA